jgi:endonuclease V-like protein UPF0215 family
MEERLNKIVYVKSFMTPIGEDVSKKVVTGEIKKGFLGGEKEVTKTVREWVQTGYSDCKIDGERLAQDIQTAVEELNKEGYEVVSVSPLTSGTYNFKYQESHLANQGWGYGYGYGYSYTEGVTIVAKKISG